MGDFKFDKNLISSAHINFLFGAGVNGKAFPQLSGFEKTIAILEEKLGRKVSSFEEDLNTLTKKSDKEEVYEEFGKEFKTFEKNINLENSSLINLQNLMKSIYKVVEESENRQRDMKQINIYTLNYDDILESILNKTGFMNNNVSATNLGENIKFLDLVAYDYTTYKYIPTFMISKLHGDINKPIYPGINKYETSLASEYFEINFRMKEQLSKPNSILIVIGYSSQDEHINKILQDCIKYGLVIYWFKYQKNDKVLQNCPEKQLIIFEQPDELHKIDTTKICSQYLDECYG